MKQVIQENGVIAVSANHYRLAVSPDRPFVSLYDATDELLCELFVPSSIHPLHDRDDTIRLHPWQVETRDDEVVLTLVAESSTWQEKEFRFRCLPHRLIYQVVVSGRGHLAEAHYFGGYYSGNLRWGSGFFRSGRRFRQLFNPEPNVAEVNFSPATEDQAIDLMGVPLPGRADWFFTPPPFAFAFSAPSSWIAMGVAAEPGANRFTALRYHGQRDSFYLTLDYEGYTSVAGHYELPAISFDFARRPDDEPAADPYKALATHVSALRKEGLVPPLTTKPAGDWWRSPIFCGWGAQCHLAKQDGGHAPDFARQDHYEAFLAALDQEQVAPGILVVDDKWQDTYGGNRVNTEKWPDLPGFVNEQHRRGRHVLLWLKAWDPEGVPVAETITNAAGTPIAVDPTNPAFRRRLRRSVRRLLAPDGYDADGFKIDFTARIPSGPGLCRHGDTWGLELMKEYLGLIYEEAKKVKADALIMTHTPHPYLADVLDMVRLNDMNAGADVARAMRHRARIARLACPQAIIDTDNWPIADKATWRAYLPLQAELGVPSLYYCSHVDGSGEALQTADYELLREIWQRYDRDRVQPGREMA